MAASTPAAISVRKNSSASGDLVGEDERVKRHIPLHPAPVQEFHQLWQVAFGEIVGAQPGVETFQPEIDRIRAVFHRGFGAVPIARRGEQFRARRRGAKFAGALILLFDCGAACHLRRQFSPVWTRTPILNGLKPDGKDVARSAVDYLR